MQDFMKKWESFRVNSKQLLNEAKKVDSEDRILSEISQDQMQLIGNFLGDLKPNSLSFEEIFQGKRRIMFPFDEPSEMDTSSPFGKMMSLFAMAGAQPNFSDSTISQEISSEKSDKKQIRKTRIGKWLNKALSTKEKMAVARQGYYGADNLTTAEFEARKDTFDKVFTRAAKDYGKDFIQFSETDLREMAAFWATKSEYYRQNPDAAEGEASKYSIIVSRAPIDVLRMSDFQDIQSCHSPGNNYFQCAVAEAQGHGLVAFVVENEEWKRAAEEHNIELQDEEIFADRSRGKSGLFPKSRVRLRKFEYTSPFDDDRNEMAVPETRTYGKNFPNLAATIYDWAQEAQPEVKRITDERVYPEFDSFIRRGGSYEDTRDGRLLNGLLASGESDPPYYSDDNTEHDESDEQGEREEAQERVDDLNERAQNIEQAYAEGSVEEDGANGFYISFRGDFWVNLPDELFDDSFEYPDWHTLSVLNDKIAEHVDMEISNTEIMPSSKSGLNVSLELDTERYDISLDGYEEFISDIESLAEDHDEIRSAIIAVFRREGLFPAGKYNTYANSYEKDAEEGRRSYENLNITVDDTEISISSEDGHEHHVDISDYVALYAKANSSEPDQYQQRVVNKDSFVPQSKDSFRMKNAAETLLRIANDKRVATGAAVDIFEEARAKFKNQLNLPGLEHKIDSVLVPENFELFTTLESKNGYEIIFGIGFDISAGAADETIEIAKKFVDWLDKNYYKAMKSVEKSFRNLVEVTFERDDDFKKTIKKGMTETQNQIERVQRLVNRHKKTISVKIL